MEATKNLFEVTVTRLKILQTLIDLAYRKSGTQDPTRTQDYLLIAFNNHNTCFTWIKIVSVHSGSLFTSHTFLVLQKLLSSSAFTIDK